MFRTRTPLSSRRNETTAQLACVRPPASVHPEPGSNSPLYVCSFAHSKLFYALVFPYLVVILYVNDLLYLSLFNDTVFSVSAVFVFASAKVIIYFDVTKCF